MGILQRRYPKSIRRYKTVHAAARVLRMQRAECEHMVHEGMLDELDASKLLDSIHDKLARLNSALYSAKITSDIYHKLTDVAGFVVPKEQWLDRSLNVHRLSRGAAPKVQPLPRQDTGDSDILGADSSRDDVFGTENNAMDLRTFRKLPPAQRKMNVHNISLPTDGRAAELREELKEAESGIRAAVHMSHLSHVRSASSRVAAPSSSPSTVPEGSDESVGAPASDTAGAEPSAYNAEPSTYNAAEPSVGAPTAGGAAAALGSAKPPPRATAPPSPEAKPPLPPLTSAPLAAEDVAPAPAPAPPLPPLTSAPLAAEDVASAPSV